MSEMNPKAAIEACFPDDIKITDEISVKPLTLGHYALLEKINSYLINADHEPDSLEVLKTMYICTKSSKDVFAELSNLDEAALEWADNLPPNITNKILKAITDQIQRMLEASPIISDGKKKVTAGTAS